MSRPLDVFIVAGEESGDQLGYRLVRALRSAVDAGVAVRGVGGPALAREGLESLFPMEDLAVVGFGAVLARLPLILRRLRETVAAILARPPDVLVLIDAQGFNKRVARRVRLLRPDIPIVKYVSPTVWAWRPGRAAAMRPNIDHLLAILPFEPAVHERLGGPPCTYVGHPLVERLGELRPDATEAARRAGEPPILLVLPGSRRLELDHLLDMFGETIGRLAERADPFEVVLPTLPRFEERVRARAAGWPIVPRVVTGEAEKFAAFRTARAALAASGTVTLELALAGVPTVGAYRVPRLDEAILRRLVTVKYALLPNLVLDEPAMPEFLGREANAAALAGAVAPLLSDTPERRKQIEALARLDRLMDTGTERPSARAARVVLETWRAKRRPALGGPG